VLELVSSYSCSDRRGPYPSHSLSSSTSSADCTTVSIIGFATIELTTTTHTGMILAISFAVQPAHSLARRLVTFLVATAAGNSLASLLRLDVASLDLVLFILGVDSRT